MTVTQRTSGLAIASLICGILGFLTFGATGLLAVIFGHMALSGIKGSGGEVEGRGLAIAGLIMGYLSFLFVGLLALMLGGSIFMMKGVAEKAKSAQADADFRVIETSLEIYRLQAGQYPTEQQGLEALVTEPVTGPRPRRWSQSMKKVPLDPWKNPYRYRFPDSASGEKPEILSDGPDAIAGTADDSSSRK